MGEDLNRVVWGWYDREVGGNEEKREKGEKKGEKGEGKWVGEDNFVAGDNICAKRYVCAFLSLSSIFFVSFCWCFLRCRIVLLTLCVLTLHCSPDVRSINTLCAMPCTTHFLGVSLVLWCVSVIHTQNQIGMSS